MCLSKLLGLKYTVMRSDDFNKLNNLLERYGLNNFQHRIITRNALFVYKIINLEKTAVDLTKSLITNEELNKKYPLRNTNELQIPEISDFNHFGENTF